MKISNEATSRQKLRVSIHWDYENVPQVNRAKDLFLFARSLGEVKNAKVYSKWGASPNQVKNTLEVDGFECIDVPHRIKNAVDFKLILDCGSDNSDIIIIVSGDCYVQILLDDWKQKKKVIVFARKGSVDNTLKDRADEFYFIEELPELVQKISHVNSSNEQCKLTYNEAIMFLIEAVKTALNKRKGTGLGYINTLMSQLFPNYQGVSCICKTKGKSFSNFGEFVKAAVKDRKIRMENQQLFLIDENQPA